MMIVNIYRLLFELKFQQQWLLAIRLIVIINIIKLC